MTTMCRALLADAFAAEPLAGSVTGVVPDWTGPDGQRGDIAAELGAPTAFLSPNDDEHQRLSVAGGGGEASVERGALAAYGALAAADGLDDGTYAVATEGGSKRVELDGGEAWVEGRVPNAEPTDVAEEAGAAALGVGAEALLSSLPLRLADGRLVVGVEYLADLRELRPDGEALAALDADIERVVAVTFETLGAASNLYARAVGAGGEIGVVEPADARAVAAALESAAAFDGEFPAELRCETGHVDGRPGEMRIDEAGRVGGRVAVSLDGTLTLPEASDDDILVA